MFPGIGNLYYKNDEESMILAGLNTLWLIAGANFYLITYALSQVAGYRLFIESATQFSWINWVALITISFSWLYLLYTIAKK